MDDRIVTWGADAHAGFGRRLAGHLVDAVVLFTAQVAFLVVLAGAGVPVSGDDGEPNPAMLTGLAVTLLAWGAYRVVLWSRGATIGQRVAHVQVRAADGSRLTPTQALVRLVVRLLSYLPLRLGFLWAALDPERRTWHDRLTDTFVLRDEAVVVAADGRGGLRGGAVVGARAAAVPTDPNLAAVHQARLPGPAAAWLTEVAAQVDGRLERVAPGWRDSPSADAARSCAFGLLLGHLSRLHPTSTPVLGAVAEAHPGFATLLAGSRLDTLREIADEPARMAAWLAPLVVAPDQPAAIDAAAAGRLLE